MYVRFNIYDILQRIDLYLNRYTVINYNFCVVHLTSIKLAFTFWRLHVNITLLKIISISLHNNMCLKNVIIQFFELKQECSFLKTVP